jgi:pimeloyl-ACP methyl ester carboxylesterase
MRRLLVPLVAAFLLLPVLPVAATQDGVVPDGTPIIPFPATPVGEQLTWLIDQLNGGAATVTEEELTAHFAPAFLANVLPTPVLLDLLQQTARQYAPITVTGFAFPPTQTGAVALVALATGERGAAYLTIEPSPPHRITRLDLAEAPTLPSPTGRRVATGDRNLYLDCTGSGGPTVVLEGGIATDWAAVQPVVAGFTRVCSYDRPDSPGSRSDPTPERTAQEVVDDLHAMLGAAGERGPYVLVGHSLGGLYVQLFAYQHPDEVAGLVLVDPTPEEFPARLAQMLASLGTPAPDRPPGLPPTIEEIHIEQMRTARRAGTLRPMPLVVLSHGRADDPSARPPGWPLAEEERIFRELHTEIVRLVPNGRHVVAEGVGHDIHQERPELVTEAVLKVVAAVREPITWATPTANPAATPGD